MLELFSKLPVVVSRKNGSRMVLYNHVLVPGSLRQDCSESKASLGYINRKKGGQWAFANI